MLRLRNSCIALLAVVFAAAAVPAEEAQPVEDGATLFYQLQILQDEVRRLQGLIEEQNYRIEGLVKEQRDRYVELDQRLLGLRPDAARPLDTSPEGGTGASGPGALPAAVSGEGDVYNRAFAVLTEARGLPGSERREGFQRALDMFATLIREHPNGQFTPNAYYWTGELHLLLDDLERGRQAFAQVVNLYDDHPKAPDALYKLGVTYHRLGDNARALEHLDRVVVQFADHTAAGLARSYAAELR